MTVKFSSFNWKTHGKRGWIIGPFFGRTLTLTVKVHDPEVEQFLANEKYLDQLGERMGWR